MFEMDPMPQISDDLIQLGLVIKASGKPWTIPNLSRNLEGWIFHLASKMSDVGFCRFYWHFTRNFNNWYLLHDFFWWENYSHIIPLVSPIGISMDQKSPGLIVNFSWIFPMSHCKLGIPCFVFWCLPSLSDPPRIKDSNGQFTIYRWVSVPKWSNNI